MSENPDQYATLLRELLVQGLIKMIEPRIMLKVRESDLDVIDQIIPEAIEEYKKQMMVHVKALVGKDDIPCEVDVDRESFLPEWAPEDPDNSCLGGFKIFANKNRTVCSQTLDDRMSLVFAQSIPLIRVKLFPSLRKPPKA